MIPTIHGSTLATSSLKQIPSFNDLNMANPLTSRSSDPANLLTIERNNRYINASIQLVQDNAPNHQVSLGILNY